MKYMLALLVGLGLWSCSKCEEPKTPEDISWKTGILENRVEGFGTLLISFQHGDYRIETVEFESVWRYTIKGIHYEVRLNQSDFVWSRERGMLEGRYQMKFPSTPTNVALSLMIGRGNINGVWHGIKRYRN